MDSLPKLPVDQILDELLAALTQHDTVILEAPPGAGKTTKVPLACLSSPWLNGNKILLLEPRRIAARSAAERMAKQLGEKVGETVGYRVRLDSKIGPKTRLEVITEGVFVRMLQDDPSLENIGLVVFDEFHERNLDADLGLALLQQGRELFRDPQSLKILIMSATLDSIGLSDLLPNAPIVTSLGRSFEVAIHYDNTTINQRQVDISKRVSDKVLQVIERTSHDDHLLVFLPGMGEIRRTQQLLEENLTQNSDNLLIAPLYGHLPLDQQRQAIAPPAQGIRKIVLATAIAESSLTIEGITIVIDSGLSRYGVFDLKTGMTKLHTKLLSQASSIQRAGRAGRTQAGSCYRLWSESQQQQLQPHTPAEIEQADLAPMALQLIQWGITKPNEELNWLTTVPERSYQQACELLQKLGAVENSKSTKTSTLQLTAHGELMADFPAHPRMAHLLINATAGNQIQLGADIAALFMEKDPESDCYSADIDIRLNRLQAKPKSPLLKRIQQQSEAFQQQCKRLPAAEKSSLDHSDTYWEGGLIALAYPERIAKQQSANGSDYKLANGRVAQLKPQDPLSKHTFLAIAQLGGHENQSKDQIYLAAPLDPACFADLLLELVEEREEVSWNYQTNRLKAERQQRIQELVIATETIKDIPQQQRDKVILAMIAKQGLDILPWNQEIEQWLARVKLARSYAEENPNAGKQSDSSVTWPDLSKQVLLAEMEEWLAPHLDSVESLKEIQQLDLANILMSLLPWPLPKLLDDWAPAAITVPSGSSIAVDYLQSPPAISVKLQEMFGATTTPTIMNGSLALAVELLSPAQRPIQRTQDLAGFWQSSYLEVKKEMKGRYPKHQWPDDPLSAIPSKRTLKKPPRQSQ